MVWCNSLKSELEGNGSNLLTMMVQKNCISPGLGQDDSLSLLTMMVQKNCLSPGLGQGDSSSLLAMVV